MKNAIAFVLSTALISAGPAQAFEPSTPLSRELAVSASIAIVRAPDISPTNGADSAAKPRFQFVFCGAAVTPENCEPIGRVSGYTREEIDSLKGRWKQAGAVALGAGEVVVGVIAGVYIFSFSVIGATAALGTGSAGTMTGLATGTVLGIAIPTGVVTFVEAVNPAHHYSNGKLESGMKRNMRRLLENGQAAFLIHKSPEPSEVLEVANQMEAILEGLEPQ